MTFVPFVPYVPPQQPASPQAQELGRRLSEAIEGSRREHPDTSVAEIRQAVQIALAGRGGTNRAAVRVLLGVLAAMGVAGFLLLQRPSGPEGAVPVTAIVVVVLLVGVALAMLIKR